jgi:hypothetical protein
MKAHPPTAGPPKWCDPIVRDRVGTRNWRKEKTWQQPASNICRRQVAKRPQGLTRVELALPLDAWHWLRRMVSERRAM